MATIAENVQNGIRLLDTSGPENWRERIDTGTLDLASLDNCILGQVFGSYSKGMDALFNGNWLFNETNAEYGFEAPEDEDTGKRGYAALREAWLLALY